MTFCSLADVPQIIILTPWTFFMRKLTKVSVFVYISSILGYTLDVLKAFFDRAVFFSHRFQLQMQYNFIHLSLPALRTYISREMWRKIEKRKNEKKIKCYEEDLSLMPFGRR